MKWLNGGWDITMENKPISIFQPSLGKEELNAVEEVFNSNWIGKGPKTEEFETKLAESLDTDRDKVTTTTCCTEGIFQILDYLKIGEGDEVILPSIGFVGVANAIVSRGATPVFCDVDKRTLNVASYYIMEKITNKTKAVILIHYGGLPCRMDAIIRLCKQNNITLIEDNACSPFSKYKGKSTGTIGDFGVWSFDAMKILVAGDCGLIHSKDASITSELKRMCYLGLMTESGLSNKIDKKWWEFNISSPSRRSIVNDITSAIGLEQLKKVKNFIGMRKKIHNMYDSKLDNLDWLKTPPKLTDDVESSYYLYWIQLENREVRDELAKYLRDRNIYTTFRYYPLHLVEFYGKKDEVLPNTEEVSNTTLCLPLHQSLTFEDVDRVIKSIESFSVKNG